MPDRACILHDTREAQHVCANLAYPTWLWLCADCVTEWKSRGIEFTAVSEPSVVDGGGSVPGQPTEAGSGGSKTVVETVA